MLEAAIDIGTNTMLLLAADVEPAENGGPTRQIKTTLEDHIRFVRLGQGVHQNRAFAPEAMERALKVFHEYATLCEKHGITKIRAFATSASRDARNSGGFYARVREETGIVVKVINGTTEARLSFIGGLLPFQNPNETVILDIGGGSTEFVALDSKNQIHGQSLDMGSVRATEMFLAGKGDPYAPGAVVELQAHLKTIWDEIEPALQKEVREKEWCGIAGTPTTLAGIQLKMDSFMSEKIDGYRMSRQMVAEMLASLAAQTQSERASNPIMGTGRADVMVAGVAILLTAMEYFDKKEIIVSSRGLRHGILLEPPA